MDENMQSCQGCYGNRNVWETTDSNPPSSAIIQSVPQAAAPSSKRAAASINAITRTTSLRGSSNLGASSVVKTYQHHCQSRSRLIIPHGKILSSKQPVVIDKTQHPVALFSFFSHPMSKDQITDHIASSLGLCPIKDSSTQPPHLSQGRKLSDVYSKKNITSNSYDNKNLEKTTNKQWAPVNVNNSKQHLPPNASFTAGSSKLSSSLGSGHTYRSSPIPATKKFISQNSPRVALSSPELTSLVPGQLPLKQSSSHPNSTTFGGHSLEGVVPEGLSMYPTGYQPNQATQAANMGTYGAQAAGLSSGFQSQLPLSPNVIPFSNQTSYFAANPAASLGGVPQQQVQVMNPLQAANQMQSNAVSYNPQLVQYQPGGTASNLHRLSSQSYQTHTNPNSMTLLGSSQASMTQFAQQPSNYPAGFSSVNLASLGGQPQALGLGAPQSLGHVAGLESDADWRFRRSKEIFEQAQKSHQQFRTSQDQFSRGGHLAAAATQPQSQPPHLLYNQTQFLNASQTNAIPITSKSPYYDSNLSHVNPSSAMPAGRINSTNPTGAPPHPVAPSEILPNYQLQINRAPAGMTIIKNRIFGPPPVSGRQSWAKFKSKSFDQEDSITSNLSMFSTNLPSAAAQINPSVQQTMSLEGVYGNSGATASGGLGVHPAGTGLDQISGLPGAIPVDLAFKLHSAHQAGHHGLAGTIGPGGSVGSASFSAPSSATMHDMHASHTLQSEYARNKSVSFNIPNQYESLLDFDESSRLAQMFPNCTECQKLEQDRLLYRQALRLRKNNSDKTLNEYMRSGGIDQRPSYIPSEDRRLKDLAQLISETFSERLLEEERHRDGFYSLSPKNLHSSRKFENDFMPSSLYTSAGQKISQTSQRGNSRWHLGADLYDDHLQNSPGSLYGASAVRSSRRRVGSSRIGDYDPLPAYKDSSQYLNLEGLSLKGRSARNLAASSRATRDLSLAPSSAGGGGMPGRHSAYASDMDSYFYDRERYGSVNLARFNDPPPTRTTNTSHDYPERRRNLKEIRYSRDYEFIPRAEDMYGNMGRKMKGSVSPTFLDSQYANDLDHRRHSPRSSRRSDLTNSGSLSYKQHSGGHRRGRSSSVKDDPEGSYSRDLVGGNSEYLDHQFPPGPPPSNSNASRNRNSQRRHGPNASSHYNFIEDREHGRRGSSSDSMDRLSSPDRDRIGHHRSGARRYHGSASGVDSGMYDDKVPPRRSNAGGYREDQRNQGPRNHNANQLPPDAHSAVDRQKLSDVPPNHSTESGYSSQSQHTAISRDDRGGMQQMRPRSNTHGSETGAPGVGGHMPRGGVDPDMANRPKDR